MMLWKSRAPDTTWVSPLRLGVHEVGFLHVLRQDYLDLAVHPLLDHVRTLRPTLVVPLQRTDDGLDLVGVQPVHQLLLAVALLHATHCLDRRRDDLTRRVRVRLVLRRRLA